MIDKITIELDDTGFFLINLGDVHHITAHKPGEVAYIINKYCKSLAHFPQNLPCANPISWEEFEKKNKAENKKKNG